MTDFSGIRVVVVAHGPPLKGGIATVALDLVEDPVLNAEFEIVFQNTSQNDEARGKFALKPIRGAIELDVRGYLDSWSMRALTTELAWDQYIARPIVLRVRARWHLQDSALFYRDGNDYASSGPVGSFGRASGCGPAAC